MVAFGFIIDCRLLHCCCFSYKWLNPQTMVIKCHFGWVCDSNAHSSRGLGWLITIKANMYTYICIYICEYILVCLHIYNYLSNRQNIENFLLSPHYLYTTCTCHSDNTYLPQVTCVKLQLSTGRKGNHLSW